MSKLIKFTGPANVSTVFSIKTMFKFLLKISSRARDIHARPAYATVPEEVKLQIAQIILLTALLKARRPSQIRFGYLLFPHEML